MDSVTIAFELMRMELDAEVESLNSEGSKHFQNSKYTEAEELIQKGRALQTFVDKVHALENEWRSSFLGSVHLASNDDDIEFATRKILSATKASKTLLLVRYPSGEIISEEKAADTLVAVIKSIGFEKVEKLNISVNRENLVSRQPSKRYNEASSPPYFIKTHTSTFQKKKILEQVSQKLGLGLKVDII